MEMAVKVNNLTLKILVLKVKTPLIHSQSRHRKFTKTKNTSLLQISVTSNHAFNYTN